MYKRKKNQKCPWWAQCTIVFGGFCAKVQTQMIILKQRVLSALTVKWALANGSPTYRIKIQSCTQQNVILFLQMFVTLTYVLYIGNVYTMLCMAESSFVRVRWINYINAKRYYKLETFSQHCIVVCWQCCRRSLCFRSISPISKSRRQ